MSVKAVTGGRQLHQSVRKSTGSLADPPSAKRESNPLPWQEETVTRNRDAGKSLIMLQKQNVALRAELVKLSEQLNEVIYETQQRKSGTKIVPQTDTSPQELENAIKRLDIYTKQVKKVKARYSKLQDPNYEIQLQQTTQACQAEVQALETWMRNAVLLKSKNERILDSVLETGETPDMLRAIGDAMSDYKVAATKNAHLERLWANDQKNYADNLERTQSLRMQVDKLQAKLARLPTEPNKKLLERIEMASKTRSGAEKQLYNVSAKLKVKLTTAEKKLSALKETESTLSEQLNQKAEALSSCSAELNSLHQSTIPAKKASKPAIGVAKASDSKNLFLTEHQYDREGEQTEEYLDY